MEFPNAGSGNGFPGPSQINAALNADVKLMGKTVAEIVTGAVTAIKNVVWKQMVDRYTIRAKQRPV